MSIEATLSERAATHGNFKSHAVISQDLKDVMRCSENWQALKPYEREALEMIAHKIARVLNGNASFADHWHDIAGYATLVEKTLGK